MATSAEDTPVKTHTNNFNTRNAGRAPLTPSRQAANTSPFTPPRPSKRDPECPDNRKPTRHADPAHAASLQATFAAMNIACSSNSSGANSRAPSSPKSKPSSIVASPITLDLGVSDFSLTGPGNARQTQAKEKRRKAPQKTTTRVNGDRFIPTRGASSPTTATKIETSTNRSTSGNGRTTPVDSVLSGGVFGSDDNVLNARVDDDDESDDLAYSRPNPDSLAYESSVAAACGLDLKTRILAFKPTAPESRKPVDLRSQYNKPVTSTANAAQFRRRILTAPERVLDAPGLVDDYYLNLLDWSSGNQVAIGLERNVYIWNADTGSVSCLFETTPDTYVSSVKWSQDGAYVAVGLGTGDVQIWDVEDETRLRTMGGHETRVGVMSWSEATLSTGCRSGVIFNHDVRIAEHKTAELISHTAEVCGLEWRSDGAQIASGGNDNLVNIWDARALATPKWTKTNHKAAVKALAWCPWQLNLLATGGGSYDKYIHFWNSTTGARVNSIDTGSQVTSLKWSTNYREIVSCHGFPDNQLSVWSYPTLVKNIEIPAHETRVLHSALSPDGQMLATCASDESLKFWKLFEKKKAGSAAGARDSASGSKGTTKSKQMTIR
ncbi:WD repeat-containing protein slp1 [Rhizina undulata]